MKRRKIRVLSTAPRTGQLQSASLGPIRQREYQREAEEQHRTQIREHSRRQREAGPFQGHDSQHPDLDDLQDVLDGTTTLESNHAEDLNDILRDIEDEVRSRSRRQDTRTRRNRTHRRNWQFESIMPDLVHAYMDWGVLEEGDNASARRWEDATDGITFEVKVVDMFASKKTTLVLDKSIGLLPALIARGLIPCAPLRPSVVITTQALEFYRVAHARCLQYAVEAFVKTLCDVHLTPYRAYLRTQFSIAYDLYLELRRQSEGLVLEALGRNNAVWRLTHACPACMYKLDGEDKLIFEMLVTMDGNDSLKRVLRREGVAEDSDRTVGASAEREDSRDGGDGYFLSREVVDRWARRQLGNLLPTEGEANPCAGRWHNMVEDVTAKMWAVFDETGIFLSLCRHGFVLLIVDMIQSGELMKYPLATTEVLLKHFKELLALGYGIGCSFETTVAQSELDPEAKRLCLRCLVGSFHGHAHNRLCQVRHLATYVKGMGLEDLEGCERCFSRSNGLARSCRYASRFHRQQEIASYFKHNDSFETYGTLSTLLCKKYRSALSILATEQDLHQTMYRYGISDVEDFEQALKDETVFLVGLQESSKAKLVETMEMEYVRRRAQFEANMDKLKKLEHESRAANAPDAEFDPEALKLPIKLRHAREKMAQERDIIDELELDLDIIVPWTPTSREWIQTIDTVRKHGYRKALDALELLVIQRLLELTKMNRSGTGVCYFNIMLDADAAQQGYKMRKHIAKALQVRSKAIRTALERYNAAATAMVPAKPTLSWEQVIDYTFLSDFDLLRDENGLDGQQWAEPMFRFIMDSFFKVERAREEVKRLNIEIRRVVTWIADERRYLQDKERGLRQAGNVALAIQLRRYGQQRGIFGVTHMQKFHQLAKNPGFTGSLTPGVAIGGVGPAAGEMEMDEEVAETADEQVDEQEAEDEEEDEMVWDTWYQISRLALDSTNPRDDDDE